MPKMSSVIKKIITIPRQPVLFLIFLYQKIVSPDHSFWAKTFFPNGYCKFEPSCSAYGYEVVRKKGLFRGIPRLIWRVLRCNPWSRGGIDLPD